MPSPISVRVCSNGNGSLPFIEQFNGLDPSAAADVVTALKRDLTFHGIGNGIGKQLGHHVLRQSGTNRNRGASTRYLFELVNGVLVLYGAFVKTKNADNSAAISAAAPLRERLHAQLPRDSSALDSLTVPLAIDFDPANNRRPYKARVAASNDDVGVLQVEKTDPQLDARDDRTDAPQVPRGAERWRLQQERAAQRSAAILEEQERRAAESAAKAENVRKEARVEAKREIVAARSTDGPIRSEWDSVPFDLDLLPQWMELDDAIRYQETVAIPEEAEGNAHAAREYAEQRELELEALDSREREVLENPGASEDESERARAAWLDQRALAAMGSFRGARVVAPKAKPPLRTTERALTEIRARRVKVEAESFHPAQAERRRLDSLRRERERVIDQFGDEVLRANTPAVAGAIPTGGSSGNRRWQKRSNPDRDRRRHRVAAHIARGSYEHGLSLRGEAFAGLMVEVRDSDAFRAGVLDPILVDQQRLKIPVGTGLASEVRVALSTPSISTTQVQAR